jgi:hypothetical protein
MLLEATITPLTSLPTAHPSPEAVRTRPVVHSGPAPSANGRFTRTAARVMAPVAARGRRR